MLLNQPQGEGVDGGGEGGGGRSTRSHMLVEWRNTEGLDVFYNREDKKKKKKKKKECLAFVPQMQC